MEHLPLNSGDCRKSQRVSMAASHLLNSRSHLRLMDARSYGPIGSHMHLRAQIDTLFYEADLLFILIVTLGNDGFDERYGGFFCLSGRLHTQKFPEPNFVVATIGRQKVYCLSLGTGFVDIVLQLFHRQRVADTDSCTFIFQRRLGASPDNIIDCEFITEHNLTILIHINDGSQASIVKSEEIEHRTVLTERISIVCIVHADLIITQKEQQATAHVTLQFCPATDISAFLYLHDCINLCCLITLSILKSHSLSCAY